MDRPSNRLDSPTEIGSSTNQTHVVDDLQTFRQALVMNGKKISLILR
jgi:hypothetical protein